MPSYRGYRFPPDIISHAVWLYHRFALSFRDVEDVLARRGVAPWPRDAALVHDSKLTDSEPNPEASHRPIRYDSGRPRSVI